MKCQYCNEPVACVMVVQGWASFVCFHCKAFNRVYDPEFVDPNSFVGSVQELKKAWAALGDALVARFDSTIGRIILAVGALLFLSLMTGCGRTGKYIPFISSQECNLMIKQAVLAGEFFERQAMLATQETVFLEGYEYRMTDECRQKVITNGNPIY